MRFIDNVVQICLLIMAFSGSFLIYHLSSPYKKSRQMKLREILMLILFWICCILIILCMVIQ